MMSIPGKSEHNKMFIMRFCLIHHESITEEELRVFTNNEIYIQALLATRRAFPDYTMDVEDITAEGDFVILHCICRGTHMAEFHGIPASYNRIEFPMMVKYQIVDDKIVNAWPMFDQLAFFEQLGVIQKPG